MREEVERCCAEARNYGYRAVVVPSSRVLEAYEAVEGSEVKVSCLVGFPFGWSDADAKRYEIETAADAGAHEIEYVPSLARLKEQQYRHVLRELRDATTACDERPMKVLVEAALWRPEELEQIISIVLDSGAKFVSMGLVQTLQLLETTRELAGPTFGVKCELPSLEFADAALQAGATVLSLARGQSSTSPARRIG
jgi:deoxyribose-phosphate aldolase